MQYVSTRDKSIMVSGAQAIAQGISKESGLFVPMEFPQISNDTVQTMVNRSYQERAFLIFRPFLPEFSDDELKSALGAAYGKNFSNEKIAPIHKLSDEIFIQELWHGPTCAFKDMALQLLPHLLTLSMKKVAEGKEAVILVATSGDTGKAALEGFRDVKGTRMMVFYPKDGVSRIQELQMTTQLGDNLDVIAVKGNFDDTQTAVKEIFTDRELAKQLAEKNMMFSSANSINWGRLMPQIVYYFSAYADLLEQGDIEPGAAINVCVPTGNFGNLLAAYYAKEMGLPIAKFICASNENHVLTDFFESGTYDRNRAFTLTNSPSMDILISSNLERLLFELVDRDDKKVAAYMESLATTGRYALDETALAKSKVLFYGGFQTQEQTLDVVATIFAEDHYLCDTHTAVALGVCKEYQEKTGDKTKTIVASTANPYKFADNILLAVDPMAHPEDEFDTLRELEATTGLEIPAQITALEHAKVRFAKVIDRGDMAATVKKALHL